ncbi:MFS transporter [Nocardia jejuensis]|uniref:MFS transporter n=1 Tax=Nocardia jejuensis TaxID=328049 RepID=UPI0008361246|nr:MFS transporter [Nocardia jejuensis]
MLDAQVPATHARSDGLGRLLTLLLPATTALCAVFNGIQQILLPAQVEALDPGSKVATLAVMTTLAAISSMLALPIGGAISDRTASRLGRRSPWLLLMSALSMLLLLGMGSSTTILTLTIGYVIVWFTANFHQGALTAVLPDRVPVERRGLASSVIGLGTPVGILFGVNVASRTEQVWGYAILGLGLLCTTVALVFGAREAPSTNAFHRRAPAARTADSVRAFFQAFGSRDFRLAFLSRATLSLAYFTVSGYLFYALQDHIGTANLPRGDVAIAVSTLSTISVLTWTAVAVFAGWLADRLDRRKLFVGISSAGLGASMLVPIVSPTWTGMLVYAFLSGAFIGSYFAVDLAVMSLVLPDKNNQGRDFAILTVATGLPQILSSALAGALIAWFGGYVALFVFGAVCAFAAGLVIMRIRSIR